MRTEILVYQETMPPWRAPEDPLDRARALLAWDGRGPPPALARCSGRRLRLFLSGAELHSVCVLPSHHSGACAFGSRVVS